jgi:hypothetical protein
MQREYPYRLWKLGYDFKRYAEVIFRNKIDGADSRPFYYMIGHANELILKSFLLTKGIELKTLTKRKYGHNLTILFKMVMKYKEFKVIKEINQIESNVDLLNTFYKDKDFEYIETELMLVKHPLVLMDDFDILSNLCKKTCEVFIYQKQHKFSKHSDDPEKGANRRLLL